MIEASAPVRICDLGGWTDTWFGGPGRVCSIAVTPGVKVSVRPSEGHRGVLLELDAFGDRYAIVPGRSRRARHRLVEAAVDEYPPPSGVPVAVRIGAGVPAGCGTGTSASLAVALIAALRTARGEERSRRQIAYAAHRLEVEVLGGESGVQDQLAAAFGGISYLEIDSYPEATVTSLPAWPELVSLLTVVFVGTPHVSSAVHLEVIERLKRRESEALVHLRDAAMMGHDAVESRDLHGFGRAMIRNTEAQISLHAALVDGDARRLIAAATASDAIGWKVNGAGGHGGSITLLSPDERHKEALERRVTSLSPSYRILRLSADREGLVVRGSP